MRDSDYTSRMVEKYVMMVEITRSIGLSFEELIDMEDYQIYSMHRELIEARIPNHLGIRR